MDWLSKLYTLFQGAIFFYDFCSHLWGGGGQSKWSLLEDFQRLEKKNELEDVRGREKQEYKDKIGKLVEKYYICL